MRDLRYDVGQLQSFNEIIAQENEELREMLRLRSAPQDTGSNADIESEEDALPSKRHKKDKGKKTIRHSEDEIEVDDEEARVCQKASFGLFLNNCHKLTQ